ncbi:MAG: methyl-accepting chemotaxis protein [Lachnospiraceae bacterium]|nr:methyl-accepting chemotaxis protein [Lachnospiraceae bacterium]
MATQNKAKSTSKLDMRMTLILYALIPLICASVVLSIITIGKSSAEMTKWTNASLVQIIKDTGTAFDEETATNEALVQAYAAAPIIKEYLHNPYDNELFQKAQQYTKDFFKGLSGWEGLYLCDWDTKVMTHATADAIIGKVLREGDSRKALLDSLQSTDGVYNTGIMTSPSSGKLVMSLYYPVMDNGTPIGYVGGATFVNEIASKISDVSSLGHSSSYIYFVSKDGTMIHHPDETKIGNAVENSAVKGLVADLAAGKHPEPACITYNHNNTNKYAAYYVGKDDVYIAVLTADESDLLSGIDAIKTWTIIISVACVIIFALLAIIVARVIATPLKTVAESIVQLGTGDVTVKCNAQSHIKETVSIISAFQSLKEALTTSMRSVKNSASVLNNAIINVDGMTGDNVESISQINAAIGEVAITSQSVAENAQTMAQKAVELGDDIENLNNNVQSLYASSQTIKNANNEATECMDSVYSGANESVEAMKSIADKISETNAAIGDIQSAIQAIESIAEETNLLSLNASIESARAGEAGRGFAVVADEIRALADSSAESAKEIKQIIENVIVLSNTTVDISNRVFEVISKEREDIELAQEKFNILSDSVEASIVEIDTIKKLAGELDSIKVELTNTTTELGAISEELGASAEEVSASCQTVTDACENTQESTTEMRNINEDMSVAIEYFKIGDEEE